jgi:hypothetical protein
VYFTAGIDHERHGLFGSLALVTEGSPEGSAEAQAVQAALDVFEINVTTLNMDLANGATQATIKQDVQAVQISFTELVHAEVTFAKDTARDASHSGASPTTLSGAAHEPDLSALDALFANFGSLA